MVFKRKKYELLDYCASNSQPNEFLPLANGQITIGSI